MTMVVEAWGNPLPFLRWYRDGQPLDGVQECRITQMGPPLEDVTETQETPVRMTGQLIINEIFPDDAGMYTCVAENTVGVAETATQVDVIQTRKLL
ncbi:unnamed protein product [Protopolystoma xenopodis]|uniref:Ig-like domain-containing protein n=1 Tax=Protopolystoma xenopodis TaxID=117903 RepID=A0A3S5ARA9_9PLAT|nr:unnamed protein product [Protopolystoma xenopodis]